MHTAVDVGVLGFFDRVMIEADGVKLQNEAMVLLIHLAHLEISQEASHFLKRLGHSTNPPPTEKAQGLRLDVDQESSLDFLHDLPVIELPGTGLNHLRLFASPGARSPCLELTHLSQRQDGIGIALGLLVQEVPHLRAGNKWEWEWNGERYTWFQPFLL